MSSKISSEQQHDISTHLSVSAKLLLPSESEAELYGVKTYQTYSADEENREGSEFDKVVLDQRLRQSFREWENFACRLVKRRLEVYGATTEVPISEAAIERVVRSTRLSWHSPIVYQMIGAPAAGTGAHFNRIADKLRRGLSAGHAPGLAREARLMSC